MRRLCILFFSILLVGIILKPCFSEQGKKPLTIEDVMKLAYRDFKEIESFGVIWVVFEGEDAQKIGLNIDELIDYVKLRFKNNFGSMKYEELSEKRWSTIFGDKAEAKKTGSLRFTVWVVGDDYPIAYHVKCDAGNFRDFSIWSRAFLGYGSKKNVPSTIKKALNDLIEKLAIDFFKARGEL